MGIDLHTPDIGHTECSKTKFLASECAAGMLHFSRNGRLPGGIQLESRGKPGGDVPAGQKQRPDKVALIPNKIHYALSTGPKNISFAAHHRLSTTGIERIEGAQL